MRGSYRAVLQDATEQGGQTLQERKMPLLIGGQPVYERETDSEEDEEWIHAEIEKEYETRGKSQLRPGNPINYLSMRLTIDE